MRLMEMLGKELLFFDGAMGTQLYAAGLPAGTGPDMANLLMPDTVRAIHRAYLEAGSHILKTNTFSQSARRLSDTGSTVREVTAAAVANARAAIREAEADGISGPHFVAIDIGPTGRLLSPLGDLDFDDALALFGETAQAGAAEGADCALIETMSDLYELKAAVLAAKQTGLPVLATVTVDAQGKLLTGADMHTVAALLEGLRADAIGLNCGLGAQALLPCLKALRAHCGLPLIINPNAGMPQSVDGRAVFQETPEDFAKAMERAYEAGACLLGGCCGTSPAHIRALAGALSGRPVRPAARNVETVVTSGARAVRIEGHVPVLIGERINPTGKPAMKRALKNGTVDYMLREAIEQQEAGVSILDVNAGLPGIPEAEALRRLVEAIQAVCDLPLQIDTASPQALEGVLRRYNGKPLINSVNGKAKSMAAVFPLVKRYGGVVVALTLDDDGIPETADGRVRVARRIIEEAARYGIDRRDILIDPLAMAVSAQPDAARVVLHTLARIRQELGVHTVLGVSNISFGLPKRGALNTAFFTLAAGAGLSAAIMNPYAEEMMQAYYALCPLLGEDPGCAAYVGAMGGKEERDAPAAMRQAASLKQAIVRGLKEEARALACEGVQTRPPLEIIETELIPALGEVGADFEKGRVFLPQLLMSAEAAKAAFAALSGKLTANERGGKGKIVIATVRGDIHDIGKNIAKALLVNFQYDVIDLGRDVPPETIVDAARAHGAPLVGLSALMTTTVASMEETIRQLRHALPDCRVMVGGAVLTPEYAAQIGADRHVRDAMDSVRYAQEVIG